MVLLGNFEVSTQELGKAEVQGNAGFVGFFGLRTYGFRGTPSLETTSRGYSLQNSRCDLPEAVNGALLCLFCSEFSDIERV